MAAGKAQKTAGGKKKQGSKNKSRLTAEERAWKEAFDSFKEVPKKKPEEPDFEDDLRRELGLKKKKKVSFEEQLRLIARQAREQSLDDIKYGSRPETKKKKPSAKGEYELPAPKKFKADFKGRPTIDEILVMAGPAGLLLQHFSYRDTTMLDDDLVSGMITVIQNFVRESFQDKKADLKELRLGEFNILIQKGRFINVVVISPDNDLKALEAPILKMILELEKINGRVIRNWHGDVDDFKYIDKCVAKLIKGRY